MSFILAIEALRFYKLKQERLVQVLFLICFAINALSLLFPLGDTNFNALNAWLDRQLQFATNGQSHLISYPPALSSGNLIFLASQIVVLILNLFFSYFYAAAYSAERDGLPAMKGISSMFRSMPKQLLLLLLLLIPAFFSMFFLLIPLVIGAMMLVFTPLLIAERKETIADALRASTILTKHRRFYLFFSFVLITMFTSLLENIFTAISASNSLALVLLVSLVSAISALIRGRLIGICYVFFAKHLRHLSLQQFINRNPQDAVKKLLGREDKDEDKNH